MPHSPWHSKCPLSLSASPESFQASSSPRDSFLKVFVFSSCHIAHLLKFFPLAGETIYADYITEYSTDRIEMHVGAVKAGQRVVLIDDLVATGGTLSESMGMG